MPTFTTPGVSGEHGANWLQWLAKYKDQPCSAVEVGSFEGRSALWFLENILTHPQSVLTCVDTWEGSEDHHAFGVDCSHLFETFSANVQPYGGKVSARRGRSQSVLRGFSESLADFIYIDGSHTAPNVLQDSVLCWPILKPGGILIWDDYEWKWAGKELLDEPMIAIDAFLMCFFGQYRMLHRGYQVAVEKL